MALAGAGDRSTLLVLGFLSLKDFLVVGFFGNELRDNLLLRNFLTIPEGLGEQVDVTAGVGGVGREGCSTSVPPSLGD